MRSLNSLALRSLSAHPLRTALTALAIALGVAMVLAASIIGQAANQSAAQLADGRPRLDLEIAARAGKPFDASILSTVRGLPAVEQAAPSCRLTATASMGELTLLGVDPASYLALHKLELANGAFLDTPDSIVLPMALALEKGLGVGDKVWVEAGGKRLTLQVAGRLRLEQDIKNLADQTTAFVSLQTCQVLGNLTGLSRIEIALRPGADVDQARAELVRALGNQFVIARTAPQGGIMGNTLLVQAALAVVGLIILFAASFVILNAFGMSITARTQELGALRALGMTRRQVLKLVLAEAGLLGLVGVLVGVLVGLGLAWVVMRAMGMRAAPFSAPLWGVALSAAMGMVVTLVAALQPAWRASRVPPLVAARAEGNVFAQRRRDAEYFFSAPLRLGAILSGVTITGIAAFGLLARPSIFVALAAMIVGQAALLGAAALLLPALVDSINALCRPALARWLGAAGRLASDNLGRNKARAALTAGALAAGLTIIVATSGLLTAGLKGALGRLGLMLHENTFVTVDISSVIASGEMSVENFFQYISENPTFDLQPVIDALDPLVQAGVIQIERCRFAPAPSELSSLPGAPAIFVDAELFLQIGNFEFYEGDPETALALMQRGRAALVPPIVAERLGVDVGDSFPLQTPNGEVTFTIAGIGGSGWMMTVLPYADGQAYFNIAAPTHLGVIVNPGQDVDAAMNQVRQALAPFPHMALSADFGGAFDPLMGMVDRLGLLLNALVLLAVIVAALGVVNTMVINVSERRRELRLLRAVGATQRQVRQMVLGEAAVLGLLAAVVADGLGLLMLLTFGALILPNGTTSIGARADGQTLQMTLGAGLRDWALAAAGALILGPLVAALAAYWPARQAAAMQVGAMTRSAQAMLKPSSGSQAASVSRLTFNVSFALALRNLQQHPLRTLLSALAIALGTGVIISTGIVESGMRNALASGESKLAFVSTFADVIFNGVGMMMLLAAGFLIFNAFAMAVTQQRQQIGLLRSLGMTRRQVLQQVLFEAMLTGGLGVLLGLLVGPLLGDLILMAMQWFGLPTGQGSLALGSVALAVVMGLGISLLSALVPARRAARVAPLAALRDVDHRPTTNDQPRRFVVRRWSLVIGRPSLVIGRSSLVGWILLAVLWVYLLIAPPGEWSGKNPPWDWGMTLLLWGAWLAGLWLALPALVGGLIRVLRWAVRGLGAVGRLMGDNLARAPGRVALTALTFAIGLMVMVSIAGFVSFGNDVLVARLSKNFMREAGWTIYPFNRSAGLAQLTAFDVNAPGIEQQIVDEVYRLTQGRAVVSEFYTIAAPEISSPMPGFPSMLIMDADGLTRPGSYNLIEGDWATALPLLKEKCGLLTTPAVAARHKIHIGDSLTIAGRAGPVTCVVAGLGSGGVAPFSIIGPGGRDALVLPDKLPDALDVRPLPGADAAVLEADLDALHARYGDKAFVSRPQDELDAILKTSGQLMQIFNGLVLLAVVAAALGMVNTTLMSIAERRRELGLLRAVGATRRQITLAVMGEAALTGLVGALLGTLAGVGLAAIFALAYGGITFGLMDLPLWEAAAIVASRAAGNGLAGLIAAPVLAALAAYPAVRAVTRGSAIETMNGLESLGLAQRRRDAENSYQISAPWRLCARKNLFPIMSNVERSTHTSRTPGTHYALARRFALGTAILMTLALVGLIAVVVNHTSQHLTQLSLDKTRQMATVNAGLIELALPRRASRLDWNTLRASGMFGNDQALSQLKSLKADMQKNGILDMTIADSDNIILVNMDIKKIGQLAPPLPNPAEASAFLQDRAGRPAAQAAAPIRNREGQTLGSVRVTMDAGRLTDLQTRLWSALGGIGLAMAALGALLIFALSAAQQLAEYAAQARRGQYALFGGGPGRGLIDRVKSVFSAQMRLTIVLTLLMAVMVGVLEFAAIPIERYYIEDMVKNNMTVWIEWLAHAASTFDVNLAALMRGRTPEPFEMLQLLESLDLERLQQVGNAAFEQEIAFAALVNTRGKIVLSDQLALIDETAPAPAETVIEDATWRGESVWIVSTPLRQGEEGKQLGALRVAVRRAQVDDFLNESRNLFRLCGLIAILAGALAAQALGGAEQDVE